MDSREVLGFVNDRSIHVYTVFTQHNTNARSSAAPETAEYDYTAATRNRSKSSYVFVR